MDRSVLLAMADKAINGDRARDYGDAYENFSRIAAGWSVILESAAEDVSDLRPERVALMMCWLKMCRLMNGLSHEDSWVDLAGYAALGGELADRSLKEDEAAVLLEEIER
jgi:hypothetical protein